MDKIQEVLQSLDCDYMELNEGLTRLGANERIPYQPRLAECQEVARNLKKILATFYVHKTYLERTNMDQPL